MRRGQIKADERHYGNWCNDSLHRYILLASLVSFAIIHLTEEIAQDSQNTAEDVRRDFANSVIITGMGL